MPSEIAAVPRGCLINGKWIVRGEVSEVYSPYDGSVVGAVHLATKEDVEAAIQAAVAAFGVTKKLGSYQRKEVLQKISTRLENRHEEFARSIALEAGKPIKTSRAEVDRAIFTFSVAAEEATRIGGEYLPLDWQELPLDAGASRNVFHLGRLPRSLRLISLSIWSLIRLPRRSRRMHDGPEAGAANSHDRVDAGGGRGRSRLACWRAECAANVK